MNLQDAIVTLQMYQDAQRRGDVEPNSQLMLHALPYAVEVILDHLLPKNQHPVMEGDDLSEENSKRIRDALNGL
jgi:hypothetical protein